VPYQQITVTSGTPTREGLSVLCGSLTHEGFSVLCGTLRLCANHNFDFYELEINGFAQRRKVPQRTLRCSPAECTTFSGGMYDVL
jgi:hypothetical protein